MPACAGGGGERDAAGKDTVANKTKENSGQIYRFLLPPYEVEQGRKNCSKILFHSPAIVFIIFFCLHKLRVLDFHSCSHPLLDLRALP